MILTVTLNPAIDRVYFLNKLEVGQVNRPLEQTVTAGGKGINVARVASILGQRVDATGFLGGRNGEFISDEIKKLGVSDMFIRIDGETRICVNITDKENGESTELLENGPTISEERCNEFLCQFERYLSNHTH